MIVTMQCNKAKRGAPDLPNKDKELACFSSPAAPGPASDATKSPLRHGNSWLLLNEAYLRQAATIIVASNSTSYCSVAAATAMRRNETNAPLGRENAPTKR